MARIRHRKSINPFRIRIDVARPDWNAITGGTDAEGIDRPFEVDLGFGRGEFLIERARQAPHAQLVGLEIRQYLIDKMQEYLELAGVANIHIMFANVKIHLPTLFDPGMLSRVYIHFPDPWTQRKKHHKRRMVDETLVSTLHTLLKPGGEVHLMTDKQVVGAEMLALFEAHGGYKNACGMGQFCPTSTTGIRTREEQYYLEQGIDIFRLRFVRE
ncbi:MAG: tRNA (guanosine(46)-N7)-methyltransferase TrmB [Anaerolineae bacterium]|nr:tRNA (guanosine(46)-N7)-methyltransferase TrmB [Anaerolineae bacterium]